MITHLLFDLDNTLYSSGYGLEQKVSERIDCFISDLLGLPLEQAIKMRWDIIKKKGYGTTLELLMAEKGFTDVELYFKKINPEDEADNLPPNPALGDFLASIPLPKAILTNSAREHADRILGKLGIQKHFPQIFDIFFNNLRGKPDKDAYCRCLKAMNAKPENTLFVDDYPRFVAGFLQLGGQAVLMDENDQYANLPYNRIKDLREIKKYLKNN